MEKKTGKPPKEKKRNSERRKEKSRDAARCRRSRETEIFTDLAQALPLSTSSAAQLDKASIMRLAISYLRVRSILHKLPSNEVEKKVQKFESPVSNPDPLYLKALEGFLIIVSADGDIVFLSENVTDYLGLSQMELMGQSIYEVSHPCDHSEVKEVLAGKDTESLQQSFFLRIKCTLTSKGRNVNLKSATYKVIHCTGHVIGCDDTEDVCNNVTKKEKDEVNTITCSQHCLVAIAEPIPHPVNIEIPLGHHTFLSKHTLDMKFSYADEKMGEFLGYEPDDLVGKSVFEFHHALDSQAVDKAFKCLFSKGQSQTGRYRFLAYGGGYAWVLTQATLIYNNKAHKPQSVVCVNHVISGIENRDEVYSCSQLAGALEVKLKSSSVPPVSVTPANGRTITAPVHPKPITATAKIFRDSPIKVDSAENCVAQPQVRPSTETGKLFISSPLFIANKENTFKPVPVALIKSKVLNLNQTLVNDNKFNIIDKLSIKNTRSLPESENTENYITTVPVQLPIKKVAADAERPQSIQLQSDAQAVENLIKTLSESKPFPVSCNSGINNNTANNNINGLLQVAQREAAQQQLSPRSGPQSTTYKVFAAAPPRPTTTTSKIFAPKTKDMNKGFLMYSDDESGLTMLKDEPEPEDLTHLAPTAGDACIPLNSGHLFSDVLDSLMLSTDNYCPLLSEASKEISPANSPFVVYRDDLSNSGSLSPPLTHSPGGCSLPSLCSLSEDSPPLEGTLLGLDLVDSSVDADEFTVKAPYIPMTESENLPLLTSDVMWAAAVELASPNSSNSCSSNISNTNNSNSSSRVGSSRSDNLRNNNSNNRLTNGWYTTKLSCPSPTQIETKLDYDSSLAKLLRADSNPTSRMMTNTANCRKGPGGGGGGTDYEKRKRAGGPDINRGGIKRSKQQPAISRPGVLDGGGKANICNRGGNNDNANGSCNGIGRSSGNNINGTVGGGNSVLMNLLVSGCDDLGVKTVDNGDGRTRLKSVSLLDPDCTVPSLLDLTEQDYAVNTPVNLLLQGSELLNALDISI
ncbi:HIF-1 transcription factor component sima [Lycorma delicatula]|uniref:HIF-1 transcription factor component sima n=1 Tax=Lycorma delicatula TaxID=130591 RepID=UPI003F51381A